MGVRINLLFYKNVQDAQHEMHFAGQPSDLNFNPRFDDACLTWLRIKQQNFH